MEWDLTALERPIVDAVRHPRNPAFERELTRQMGRGLRVDVEHLNRLAGQRACTLGAAEYGSGLPEVSRDLEREAIDEMADARNYLVWRLDQIHRGLVEDDGRTEHLQIALRHVALAFEEIRRALRA